MPEGVVIESTAVTANLDDSDGHAVGPLRVFGYLPMDGQLEERRRQLEQALWYLGRIRPLPAAQFKPIQQANWAEAWKQHYQPIAVGESLMIVPAWLEQPAGGRIPIRIDPGMAFGTGTHPTTQLCLQALETAAPRTGDHWEVIDLGCGTAILAIAALKLGARHALAVDIDPEAIRAAQENAQTNRVTTNLELGVGSLEEIRSGAYTIRNACIVMANILAPVLIRLLGEGLGDILADEGVLILSGILQEQAVDVQAAAEAHGLRLVARHQIGDWVALSVARAQ